MFEELIAAIVEQEEDDAVVQAERLLEQGVPAAEILGACQKAMDEIGRRFDAKEYFLPELLLGADIMKALSAILKPHMRASDGGKSLGKFVIGTVKGDIHDIGKDIVGFLFEVNGFEVHDLGVDVPPEAFVQKIEQVRPDIVGMSGLLTLTFDSMKETVAAIERAGLRDKVKIIVGGGAVGEDIRVYAGADAYADTAVAAVSWAKQHMEAR
ncbi:MAG: corrinoid protein [Bacillota bacterium]